MTNNLLVILPSTARLDLPDAYVEDLIYRVLQTKPLTPAQSILAEATDYATGPWGKVATILYLPKRVHSNLDLFKKLVVGLYETDPDLANLGIRTVKEGAEVLQRLVFLGESRYETGIVYARHPHDHNAYIRISDFHRFLLDEKRHEFLNLAMSLGAKSISVREEQRSTESRRAHAKASAPTKVGAAEAELRAHKSRAESDYFNLSSSALPQESRSFRLASDGSNRSHSGKRWPPRELGPQRRYG